MSEPVTRRETPVKPLILIEEEARYISGGNVIYNDVIGEITFVKSENPYYLACPS